MKTKAVVTMNTDSRPASSGSRGEVGWRRRPLGSGGKHRNLKLRKEKSSWEGFKQHHLCSGSPSSPTFSSDGASWRVGLAGPPPVAGATWCPTAAVTVVGNPEVDSAVGAGQDGAVKVGPLVSGASLTVGRCCRWVEFPESVGAEKMVSPVKG